MSRFASISRSSLRSKTVPRAWLHRKGHRSWLFERSERYGDLVHITRNGTIYAIGSRLRYGKPLCVERLRNGTWSSVERQLKAVSIEFENGGYYWFPSE